MTKEKERDGSATVLPLAPESMPGLPILHKDE
jgi:hypothetical protein